MDLYAHKLKDEKLIEKYISANYGEVPRNRGVRFMKIETPYSQQIIENNPESKQEIEMFNKYTGQDVIYIHTRCGDCGLSFDSEDSNYVYCGAKEWEKAHSDLFLDHISEGFDSTYCSHYFKAVINDDYNKIIEIMKKGETK